MKTPMTSSDPPSITPENPAPQADVQVEFAPTPFTVTKGQVPQYSRSAGIDFGKGFGILSMFIIHAIIQQLAHFDGSLFIPTFSQVPVYFLLPLVPVLLLALWGTAFTYLSVVGITLQVLKVPPHKTKKLWAYIGIRVVIGLFILFLRRLSGIFSTFLRRGFDFTVSWQSFYSYEADTLDAIVWSVVICTILLVVLKTVSRRFPRLIGNWKVVASGFIVLAYLWLLLSPYVIAQGEIWFDRLQAYSVPLLPLIVGKFVKGRFKLAQSLSFGLMGIAFGAIRFGNYPKATLKRFTWAVLLFSTVVAGISILSDLSVIEHFTDEDVPLALQVFNLGGVMMLMNSFMVLFDFVAPDVRSRRARKSRWVTRYGLISLTGFCLGTAITQLPFNLMVLIFGPSVNYDVPVPYIAWKWWQILLYIVVVWLFWELLLRLWEKVKFVGSVDWLLSVLTAKVLRRGKVGIPIQKILYLDEKSPAV